MTVSKKHLQTPPYERKNFVFGEFTLIELLIVITIIMILAGLLMPALSRAKAVSRMTACAGNLKQIGLLITGYADENNSSYPMSYNPNDTYMYWAAKLTVSGGLKNMNIFLCPSVSSANAPVYLKAKVISDSTLRNSGLGYESYGINRYGAAPFASDTELRPARITQMPSDLLVAVDFEDKDQPYDGWYLSSQSGFSESKLAPMLLERHRALFNQLCADGHVSSTSLNNIRANSPTKTPWYYYVYTK